MPSPSEQPSAIDRTLSVLERTEANLQKAEKLLDRLEGAIPSGIVFDMRTTEYDEWCRQFDDLVSALPSIQGFKVAARPLSLNAIAQMRLDVQEVGEIEMHVDMEERIAAPGRELQEYRYRLVKRRRQLVRNAASRLIQDLDRQFGEIDADALADAPNRADRIPDEQLAGLRGLVLQLETLFGAGVHYPARWADLKRHLHFGLLGDLHDLVALDWPASRPGLDGILYADDEPLPVSVQDLSELEDAPTGAPIPTRLHFERLSAEEFERLLFALLTATSTYENPAWLTQTNAADRGRDLSASRVSVDPLAGSHRGRVLVQCRHWQSRSISVTDIAVIKEQVRLWEPPRVDVLILVTSGRFTTDAVQAVETHNMSDVALRIELWPNSHLEMLLAGRPTMIAEFNLR